MAYITCKDNRSFAYVETTNKGFYEVLSISEDGNTCHIKTVWHENKELVGKEYDIPTERATEDFSAVDEMVVIGALERQMLSITGWTKYNEAHFEHQVSVQSNISNYLSSSINRFNHNDYRNTREFLYIPTEEDAEMPKLKVYASCCKEGEASYVASTINSAFQKKSTRAYVETFIVVERENFDEIVEDVIRRLPEEYRNKVEYPQELKLSLRSIEHKVVVLRSDNAFAYITNVDSDNIFFNSTIFFAEQIGRPLNEDAKAALLARDQGAYYAAIYANIDVVMAGMQDRAKIKMFEDFSGNFGGMLVAPLRQAVDHARAEYERVQDKISELFVKLQDANAKLFYAEHGVENGENEFISFINDAKSNIVSIKARPSDSRIDFCIRTFLTYWDDDLWEIVRKSDERFKKLRDWQKLLLDEIFKDRTVKLLIEQKFTFNLYYGRPENNTYYDREPYGEGTKGMRNPHINEFNCWGTHESHIRDAIGRADYVQAYSQSVACISGLTLSDSPVMDRFFRYIKESYTDFPCLYIEETGQYITINDYKQLVDGKKWEV